MKAKKITISLAFLLAFTTLISAQKTKKIKYSTSRNANKVQITKPRVNSQVNTQLNTLPREKVLKKMVTLPGFKSRQNISYVVRDNMAIYEGDIELGSSRNVVDPKPSPNPKKRDFSTFSNGQVSPRRDRLVSRISDGILDRDWLWHHGIIPYRIRREFTSSERATILSAIQEINLRTNLNIIPNHGRYNHIVFFKNQVWPVPVPAGLAGKEPGNVLN